MEIGENETEKYENLIEEYKHVFHQNHFQVSLKTIQHWLDWQENLTFKAFSLRSFSWRNTYQRVLKDTWHLTK